MASRKLSVAAILVFFSCLWTAIQGELRRGKSDKDIDRYNSIKLPDSYDFYMLTTTRPPFDYQINRGKDGFKLVIDTNPQPVTTTTKSPPGGEEEDPKDPKEPTTADISDAEVQNLVDGMLNSMEKDGTLSDDRYTMIRPLLKELTPVYNNMRGILRDKERAKAEALRLRNRFRERRRRLLIRYQFRRLRI